MGKIVADILTFEQPIKLLFSIREEYLGHLYDFEKAVPQLLRKKLRVEPMNLDKVRQVIHGATHYKNTNVHLQAGEEAVITEQIFEKIKGTEKMLSIQLPYLQVFLDKFYLTTTQDESRQADAIFTIEAIQKIGDIGDVLRDFLEEQVTIISKKLSQSYPEASIETIWKILSPFATLEGTKEPITKVSLLERLPNLNQNLLNSTVQAFVNSRILRYSEEDGLYEIAHDSLAKRIADKRSDEEIALLEIRRLIKSQTSLKADAREFFTEKQLIFIEPYLEKLPLSAEERTLIEQSHQAVQTEKTNARDVCSSLLQE